MTNKISLGRKYRTRDGREVRIDTCTAGGLYPVRGDIGAGGDWRTATWTDCGEFWWNECTEADLIEVPDVQRAPESEPAPAKEPAIDWTKPVYQDNDEAFEYPGEVLCTTHAGKYPVAVWWPGANSPDSYTLDGRHHAYDGYPSVCNKPEEKPPVVTHERWVNLYSNGECVGFNTKADADSVTSTRVHCHRIAWNSDGSPVVEKGMKVGWVNLYHLNDGTLFVGSQIHPTEVEAVREAGNLVITTIQITYPDPDYKDGQGEGV